MGTGMGGARGGAGGGGWVPGERWWRVPFLALASVSFLISLILLFLSAPRLRLPSVAPSAAAASAVRRGPDAPPCLAYLLTGARGDGRRLLRLLLAVYHPRNRYVLHLSADAPDDERLILAAGVVAAAPAVGAFDNVAVVGNPTAGTPVGSSGLAGTLRAAALLLRLHPDWDWFLTLNAADYPLVTQDDLIHVLSSVPRDLNFIDHTSSPWVILNRRFIEYCVLAWENLPRILLMYFNNIIQPQEGYFHSVICNSLEFRNFTVNTDLRFMQRDDPAQAEPPFLSWEHYGQMVDSGAPFARPFQENDPLLNQIDGNILKRRSHGPVPGAWCSGRKRWFGDPCSQWGDVNIVRPGPQAVKLHQYVNQTLEEAKSSSNSCRR
ncbi:Beta-glucuronosyltransferase GlcAT14A [Dichanthelium oligosanthes]|uniref:Beta-glucuronosyltransferase GlcAT14A n=1 Tax=Dichanthelium oligosanthes TaxID=888268 RepID=A0A1E5UMQ1_9POAL|nr:Beta-glucuronosyltransferase GlcAT14A [Dichanthelium oligosanthes]